MRKLFLGLIVVALVAMPLSVNADSTTGSLVLIEKCSLLEVKLHEETIVDIPCDQMEGITRLEWIDIGAFMGLATALLFVDDDLWKKLVEMLIPERFILTKKGD